MTRSAPRLPPPLSRRPVPDELDPRPRSPTRTGPPQWRSIFRRRAREQLVRIVAAVVSLTVVAVWHGSHDHQRAPSLVLPDFSSLVPDGSRSDRLIIEPDDGMAPIDDLLASARHRLDLTMYELADPVAERILATDAAAGVRVRVVLDGRLERTHNSAAATFLRARGVEVVWSSDRYSSTHEKAFVVDGRVAVVMSLNLASRYYPTTRDVAVVDHAPADIDAIETVFTADLSGRPTSTPAAADLVWSPTQSLPDLVSLIRSAHRSVTLESEELSSATVVGALVDAARRGIDVTVVMTYQSDWVPGFDLVTAAGGHVLVLHGETPLYIHAKVLLVDAGTPAAVALVGSQNLGPVSLTRDRELGIELSQPALVTALAAVVNADVMAGTPWSG